MLETIGEYAFERLDEFGECEDIRARHAEHFLALVPRHGWTDVGQRRFPTQEGASKEELERLEEEYDNVRVAVNWLQEQEDPDRLLRLTHALYWTFLIVRGRISEGRPMLEAALAVPGDTDPGIRADALATVAIFAGENGENLRACDLAAESLALARSLDDRPRIARALRTLARYQAEVSERRRMLLECEALARETGDDWSLAWVGTLLGFDGVKLGDYEQARIQFENGLRSFERLESLHAVEVLGYLGSIAAAEERYDEARSLLLKAVRGALAEGARNATIPCFDAFAAIALAEGDSERSARLLAAAARLREEAGDVVFDRSLVDRTGAAARERLGTRFDAEWEAGWALSFDEAVDLALAEVTSGG